MHGSCLDWRKFAELPAANRLHGSDVAQLTRFSSVGWNSPKWRFAIAIDVVAVADPSPEARGMAAVLFQQARLLAEQASMRTGGAIDIEPTGAA